VSDETLARAAAEIIAMIISAKKISEAAGYTISKLKQGEKK